MSFGKKVAALRKEKSLSQMKLAKSIQKSQAYLSSIESDDRLVSQAVLWAIIEGLSLDQDQSNGLVIEWLEDCGEVVFETCPLSISQREVILSIQEKISGLDDDVCDDLLKTLNSSG